jgi:hypothetical protein
MRYYFHLHGESIVRDNDGREFSSREEAVRFARAEASAMAAVAALHGTLDLSQYVEVATDSDGEHFRVTLGDVVRVTDDTA